MGHVAHEGLTPSTNSQLSQPKPKYMGSRARLQPVPTKGPWGR